MTQAALLVPSLTEGDAVGNDVLGMARGLNSRGCDVGIFAIHGEVPGVEVRPVERVRTWLTDPAGVAIYHSSTSWPDGLAALTEVRARRVIKYHNVTPAEFFQGYHQDFVDVCAAGRYEVDQLARGGHDWYLADSEFNLRELVAAGAPRERGTVVPPFHHIDH